MRSTARRASLAREGLGWPVGISHFRVPLAPGKGSGTNSPSLGLKGVLEVIRTIRSQRGFISMGNIRTWSLAVVAGIFVVVVAHQRSNADAGLAGPGAAPATAPVAVTPAPVSARVTGLPDFSGLVAENGAAVVNISVVEKPKKMGNLGERGD